MLQYLIIKVTDQSQGLKFVCANKITEYSINIYERYFSIRVIIDTLFRFFSAFNVNN